jgi:hypothetical protein
MATLYGSNYSNAYIEEPKSSYGKGEYNGHLKCLYDEHTFAADVNAINDVIKMGKLPAGSRVVGTVVKMPATGTTGIFEFGYAANAEDVADADGFDATVDAGGTVVHSFGDGVAIGKRFNYETEVQLNLTEATDSALGDTVKTWVYYIVD